MITGLITTQPDLQLAYEIFEGEGPTVLLIMGLGAQMLLWPEPFCRALAERGHRVIRFDNRDVGLSTRLDHLQPPPLWRLALASMSRQPLGAPYALQALADDAAALLDGLGVARAHVVGASMGGMIAQLLAIHHPERVASLVSIMSTPWAHLTGYPSPRTARTLLSRPRGGSEEAVIEHMVRTFTTIGSQTHPPDPEELAVIARACAQRGVSGNGFLRQLAAILDAPDRRPALQQVQIPATVIHGRQDPLVRLAAGEHTAAALPDARLLIFDDMGHDLPRHLWPEILDAIADTVARSRRGAYDAPQHMEV